MHFQVFLWLSVGLSCLASVCDAGVRHQRSLQSDDVADRIVNQPEVDQDTTNKAVWNYGIPGGEFSDFDLPRKSQGLPSVAKQNDDRLRQEILLDGYGRSTGSRNLNRKLADIERRPQNQIVREIVGARGPKRQPVGIRIADVNERRRTGSGSGNRVNGRRGNAVIVDNVATGEIGALNNADKIIVGRVDRTVRLNQRLVFSNDGGTEKDFLRRPEVRGINGGEQDRIVNPREANVDRSIELDRSVAGGRTRIGPIREAAQDGGENLSRQKLDKITRYLDRPSRTGRSGGNVQIIRTDVDGTGSNPKDVGDAVADAVVYQPSPFEYQYKSVDDDGNEMLTESRSQDSDGVMKGSYRQYDSLYDIYRVIKWEAHPETGFRILDWGTNEPGVGAGIPASVENMDIVETNQQLYGPPTVKVQEEEKEQQEQQEE